MKHEQFIPSINAQALKTSNQYVCWIDTMGTQNTMSESFDYITLNVPPVALSIVPLQKMSLSVRQSYDYF